MPETLCPPGQICRPTFWNIPEFIQVALYLLAVLSIGLFFFGIYWRHIRFWRRGKGSFQVDHLADRVKNFLTFGVATKKVVSENQPAGFMHFNLMWGMVILFIGTVLATIDWDITRNLVNPAQWRLLQDGFYFFYKSALDLFGFLALVGLAIAFYLRYVNKPRRLWGYGDGQLHFTDDLWVVGSFAVLVLTGFMIESLRIAATQPDWAVYSPLGLLLSNLWRPLGEGGIRSLHLGAWLFHSGLTLFWVAYLPYSKFFHIFSSSTNTFFKKLTPPNAITPIQNIEEQETFGVSKFGEFTWKQVMDFDACTRCGRCQAACPASLTLKALSPKMIEVKLFEYGRHEGPATTRAIHGDTISAQELWDCTSCMACVEACPVGIDQLSTIIDLRRYLTLSQGAPQPPSNKAMDSMERQGNPYGLPKAARWDALKDMNVKFAEPGEEYEVLYWVGCAGAYDARSQKITRALVKIFQAAGVQFAILREERCNCESARRLGNEYLYQLATAENVQNLSAVSFKRIVTQCPHCFNTIKNEYPQSVTPKAPGSKSLPPKAAGPKDPAPKEQGDPAAKLQGFEGKFEVVHHTQFIDELISAGRIKPRPNISNRITYHDSCYLGRYNGIFEPQRKILKSLGADGNLVEMERSRSKGLCCGGGGGRMWLEENTGERINQLRIQDVLDVQAQTVASACPFCMTMLEDGAKSKGVDEALLRRDIAELVAEAL